MSAGHNDPRLLYSIGNIRAYHLQNGEESPLSTSGPQTLSLLMVPTSSPFADLSSSEPQSAAPEEDFYLHLHLPPELDLPLPATTQIYHQPPRSYLIPRWDLGPESGAFTRIEFPSIGHGPDKVTQEDIDTFETILAQCTAFLERARPPTGKGGHYYNPASYAPGEGYVGTGANQHQSGHIVLIDEEDGSVVGELSQGFDVVEGAGIEHGSKRPVEIQLPQEGQGNRISVNNVSEDYLKMSRHPAYKDSALVQNAATASRLIVTGSDYLANALASGAQSFTQKTRPNPEPMAFTPTTQARIRKLNSLSQSAAGLSAKTVSQVSRYAQNLGATMARRGEQQKKAKGFDKDGRPIQNYKPGLLNKSMMAFSTIADGVDQGARNLLNSGSVAATTVVGHRYGEDARTVASNLTGGVKNVGLVYVDAAGVSRRAVIKSVAKGMVVGKMPGGGDLVVGGGDGGSIPPEVVSEKNPQGTVTNEDLSGAGLSGGDLPGGGEIGFGNAALPTYGSTVGEPLGSQGVYGQGMDPFAKR
ncbi:MAG: hypothetical protein FRX48_01479 [Lasallia pustulata]|uniref:Senescence domain-containing protein n=1 Tax=Lasallia pustulata TaxID=136370 RepID=A0A5M8PY72_9LECA|nr:MAG: hypothetical protein FRX48_01479 [Lasallia pustulata]